MQQPTIKQKLLLATIVVCLLLPAAQMLRQATENCPTTTALNTIRNGPTPKPGVQTLQIFAK